MNFFAVNEAAINEAELVDVTLEGSSAIELATSFDGLRGAPLVGSLAISLSTTGDGVVGKMLEGDAPITLTTTGTASTGKMLEGTSPISLATVLDAYIGIYMEGSLGMSLDTQMTGSAGVMLSGDTSIVLDAEMVGKKLSMAQGTIPIELITAFDGMVSTGIMAPASTIYINLDPLWMRAYRVQAHRPDMPLTFTVGGYATAWLEMHGDEGVADIDMLLSGASRLGNKVYLEGESRVELVARLDGRRYAQVRLEGLSEMALELIAEKAGRPLIPVDYVQAPPNRRFTVAREARERRIFDSRRL